jgi:drug/metabolite transporter (DMT)-like permease
MKPRAETEVDPAEYRRRRAAGVGLGILFAAMAGTGWVAADAVPGRSNGGGFVEIAGGMAAIPCCIAAYEAIQHSRGRTTPARATGWFVAACAALLSIIVAAAISNSGLG